MRDFYHLGDGLPENTPCSGTACYAAGGEGSEEPRVYCLGRCFEAPVTTSIGGHTPNFGSIASESIVLEGLLTASNGRLSIDAYRAAGGYLALQEALDRGPDEIILEVKTSRLRGRGGAGFPAGIKWEAVAGSAAPERHIIANADEGDPGAYIDRFLLEYDPHLVIEGMIIAALAVGAEAGHIYLRAEYPGARKVLLRALAEAREAGILGASVLGSGSKFDIELHMGQGSYVCGEETALIASIEGRRPEPWERPPYPIQAGIRGMPTLVNNVETLANIPWIIRHGGEAYAAIGTGESRGTKAVSLNSLFVRPGIYEVDFGTPLSTVVEELGGGIAEGDLLGVMVGGPLAGLVPPHLLDTPLSFEALSEINCSVGHGGVIAFRTNTTIEDLICHVASFVAYESCGKCTPCRTGSSAIAEMKAGATSLTELSEIANVLTETSLCGHGSGFGEFLKSVSRHYPKEVERCFG